MKKGSKKLNLLKVKDRYALQSESWLVNSLTAAVRIMAELFCTEYLDCIPRASKAWEKVVCQ